MKSIIKPLLSEKTAQVMDSGVYVFYVTKDANKTTVAQELKALYNVDAVSVRIANLPAKKVNFKRHIGTRSLRHKAYVQLKAKQVIPGFEVLKEAEKKAKQADEAAAAEAKEEKKIKKESR